MTRARGLSLVELLVAMAMSSTVLVGAVAAIGIGGRAFRASTEGVRSASAMDVLEEVSADIELALAFTERSETATEFYVPDRTGDGAPELIRYTWSGTNGDPLTLSINGSTPVPVLRGVARLSLDYVVATIHGDPTFAAVPPPPPADVLLFERSFTNSGLTYELGPSRSIAAIVAPASSESRFRITRVRIPVMSPADGGDITVSLHRVNMVTATPEPTVLASATVSVAELSESLAAVEFAFSSATDFASGDYVAIAVSQQGGLSTARVALEPSPRYLTDGWCATSIVAGVWSVNATRDLPIEIFGIIEGEDTDSEDSDDDD